ncbi:hypothetical protein EBZ39_04495 [bacterium]|nr:hypothetical protein [bacterium]
MAEKQDKPVDKFYAVVLTADGDMKVEEFESAGELATRLKSLVDRDVTVFQFFGQRLHISKPPFRHLMTPQGNIPLFDATPDSLEPDETGYLGMDPIYFEGPPQIKVSQQRTPNGQADEFFDDSTEDVTNIFDNILPDPDA